ncbi:MAG: cytochrome c-type biogenesis protein CcmH [Candidatus Tokpelaia sp. JSC189]|nr:MAG: cytochrome c-type biogenesis protein CcmH [Candidatus Tokpelaia sp. JSC189]
MRIFLHFIVLWVVYLGFIAVVSAVLPNELLPDQKLEMRARVISAQLRCLVCRNETIDDSNAFLARDLRLLVRERLQAGDSDRQVLDFIVARYGEYILLKPRFSGAKIILWLAPVFILMLEVAYIVFVIIKRKNLIPLTLKEKV